MGEEIKNTYEEMQEIDIWEFSLDDEEIDELVEKLKELKSSKTHFDFEVDDENELLVRHADEEEGE